MTLFSTGNLPYRLKSFLCLPALLILLLGCGVCAGADEKADALLREANAALDAAAPLVAEFKEVRTFGRVSQTLAVKSLRDYQVTSNVSAEGEAVPFDTGVSVLEPLYRPLLWGALGTAREMFRAETHLLEPETVDGVRCEVVEIAYDAPTGKPRPVGPWFLLEKFRTRLYIGSDKRIRRSTGTFDIVLPPEEDAEEGGDSENKENKPGDKPAPKASARGAFTVEVSSITYRRPKIGAERFSGEEPLLTLPRESRALWSSAAFSPDGKLAVSGFSNGVVKLRRASDWREQRALEGHITAISHLLFSPDGTTLVTASEDGALGLWDVQKGETRKTLRLAGNPTSLVFLSDGKLLATAWGGATVDLLDARNARKTISLPHAGATQVAAGAGSILAATASPDGVVRLWDTAGKPLRSLRAKGKEPVGLAFGKDGKTLLVAPAGGKPELWDTATGAFLREVPGAGAPLLAAALSPNGKQFAVVERLGGSKEGGGSAVTLWDTSTWEPVRNVAVEDTFSRYITRDLSFSPDGKRLITVGRYAGARVWAIGPQPETEKAVGATRTP